MLIMVITRAKKENYADCPTPRSEVIHQWGCGVIVILTPHSSCPVSKHQDGKGENNSSLTTGRQYGSCFHFLQSQWVAHFPKNKLTLSRSDNASHMDTFLLCTTCKKGQLRITSQPDSPRHCLEFICENVYGDLSKGKRHAFALMTTMCFMKCPMTNSGT